jgi:hypothetical protein
MNGNNDHWIGKSVLALLIIILILGIIALVSPRYRRRMGVAVAWIVGGIVAMYLVIRSMAPLGGK